MTLTPLLARRPATAPGSPRGLTVADLLTDAPATARLLLAALSAGDRLDAYLAATAIGQLLDDAAHPDLASLRRTAAYLAGHGGAASVVARGVVAVAATAEAARTAAHAATGRSRLRDEATRLARGLVADLAAAVVEDVVAPGIAGADVPAAEHARWTVAADRLHTLSGTLPPDVVRVPACFRSFDQHPRDQVWLAREYLVRRPDRTRPTVVVGVRTSGSYLAPLFAAALRRFGAQQVEVMTLRPHRGLSRAEHALLRRVGRGGQVAVLDDPPGTGASLAAAARTVARHGVPDRDIVLALSLFADARGLPETLDRWPAVLQPWPCWDVHERLDEQRLADALARWLDPADRLERIRWRGWLPTRPARGHVRAHVTATLAPGPVGDRTEREIEVSGVGLGYLGRVALAVADALPDDVPAVYGLDDGLLFSAWTPGADPDPADPHLADPHLADTHLADTVGSYVARRARALPAVRDPAPVLAGRDPVWEVAANQLAPLFGRLAPVARVLVLQPLVRSWLRVGSPSVVDGHTALGCWRGVEVGRPVKHDAHERAFGNLELTCYDPVFDLAGAAADTDDPAFPDAVRRAFGLRADRPADAERFLLYRLAQLWRAARTGEVDRSTARRRVAAAVDDYLAEQLLADLGDRDLGDGDLGDGVLCAIDLDGVVDTDPLGHPAATPASVLALRALRAHGYRPVPVTGRGIDDVRRRCALFGLAGGVAEYGLAIYAAVGDAVTCLATDDELAALADLRRMLAQEPDVTLDASHRFAVRARTGARPLDTARTAALLRQVPGLTAVPGQSQTDFRPVGIDKATGLQALSAALGADCRLVVGDGPEDVVVLTGARAPAGALARAPRHAGARVRAAGVMRTRHAYQAGLADAVADLLGHRPGGCPTCRPAARSRRTATMLRLLAVRETGVRGVPARALPLLVAAARATLTDRRATW